jgi:hypothetical protein
MYLVLESSQVKMTVSLSSFSFHPYSNRPQWQQGPPFESPQAPDCLRRGPYLSRLNLKFLLLSQHRVLCVILRVILF